MIDLVAMEKTHDNDGLVAYLEGLLAQVRAGTLNAMKFGHRNEARNVTTLPDDDLVLVPSGDQHHEIHVRNPAQAAALANMRAAYTAGGGRQEGFPDVDPREFGPRSLMRPTDPKYDVYAVGAARVLMKEPLEVTETERHRFRMAYLHAFGDMNPTAHEEMQVIRNGTEAYATYEQCDGTKSWDSVRSA